MVLIYQTPLLAKPSHNSQAEHRERPYLKACICLAESWKGMCLSRLQIQSATISTEITRRMFVLILFIHQFPNMFQGCQMWLDILTSRLQ